MVQENILFKLEKNKERDLTQSYDKSPYTNRKFKKGKWQHENAIKLRLHNDWWFTKDRQLE